MDKINEKSTEMSDRISAIRAKLCSENNTIFAEKINKSTQYASALCTGASNPGKGMLEEILAAFPEVSRSWLYFGEGDMLKADPKPYESDREEMPHRDAEEPATFGNPSPAYLIRENDRLWQRYDEAQQTIGSLRAQLSQLKEKLNSVSVQTPSAPTFV